MMIYICCAGSGTSLCYATWIKEQLENDYNILLDSIKKIPNRYTQDELDKYDLILAHGSAFISIPKFFEEHKFKEFVNLVYLMPQVAFNLPKFKDALEPFGIPCIALTPAEVNNAFLNHDVTIDYLKNHIEKYNVNFSIKNKSL